MNTDFFFRFLWIRPYAPYPDPYSPSPTPIMPGDLPLNPAGSARHTCNMKNWLYLAIYMAIFLRSHFFSNIKILCVFCVDLHIVKYKEFQIV